MASQPVSIKKYGVPTGGFYGDPRPGRKHIGLDIKTPIGTPLKATRDSTVKNIYKTSTGGLTLELQSLGRTATSTYLHLSRTKVRLGQRVKEGEVVALSGNSGSASEGPHLHIEERKFGLTRDPLKVYGVVLRTKKVIYSAVKRMTPVLLTSVRRIPSNLPRLTRGVKTYVKPGKLLIIREYSEWSNGKKFYRTEHAVLNGLQQGFGKSKLRLL